MPDPYILILFVVGALIALVAWLPLIFRRAPLSLPIVCVVLGAAIFSLPQVGFDPMPQIYPDVTERMTEFVVIIALMGAGLKIDRIFNVRRWGVTWRLLGVTMMLSVAAIVLLGWGVLGLGLAGAILLAGSLAPTDPVLASDIQVGAPREGGEDTVRFGLTSEAGLNDGLAFPFVNLAIALALVASGQKTDWFVEWLTVSVLWEIGAGLGVGWVVGWLFGWLTFAIPISTRLAATRDGFIVLAATFISYSVTEMLHCYGFLAVFITALAFRHADRDHDFHVQMHDFIEQIERMAMMVVLVLFGGALVSGLLGPLRPIDVAAAVIIVLVVRPLTGLIGFIGWKRPMREKLILAFFGIRGVGSFYYLAFGLNAAPFEGGDRLWALVGLICLMSILLHGVTVTPVMRWFDRSQGRNPDENVTQEGATATDSGRGASS
ncbi:sodium:proton antiporter [Phenylobacterium sp.]|uniref:cation:proton antiporter n=1 Tax=Phenylobacterium sp. TaxID=1871053 RepID=UPI00272F86F9|nr:cation:proton antiporter [Phenylobacterium sp.]MDP1873160.1 cation:proton antiporter [Phenylobacterium sp.]